MRGAGFGEREGWRVGGRKFLGIEAGPSAWYWHRAWGFGEFGGPYADVGWAWGGIALGGGVGLIVAPPAFVLPPPIYYAPPPVVLGLPAIAPAGWADYAPPPPPAPIMADLPAADTEALIGAAVPPPIVVSPPALLIAAAPPPPVIFAPRGFAFAIAPPILTFVAFGPQYWRGGLFTGGYVNGPYYGRFGEGRGGDRRGGEVWGARFDRREEGGPRRAAWAYQPSEGGPTRGERNDHGARGDQGNHGGHEHHGNRDGG